MAITSSQKLSFAQILEEKISSQEEKNHFYTESVKNAKTPFTSTSENVIWPDFQLKIKPRLSNTQYKNLVHERKTPQPESFSLETFSPAMQIALERLGFTRSQKFTERDLKKKFKTMARKLHPDLNPSTSPMEFYELKMLFNTLFEECAHLRKSKHAA